jgi:hypothetical protein
MKKIQEYMKNHYFVLMVSLMMAMNALAVVTWNGTSSTAWTQGAGTAASPYIISSPAHLAYLAQQVNAGNSYSGKYFKQTQDFNLNSKTWTPIGTSTNMFEGTYDGGSKYISNLKQTLFGYINDAEIKNLTLQGADLSATSALVTNTAGACKIINCHNQINISANRYSGGLVAVATGTSLEMTSCSNSGTCTIGRTYSSLATDTAYCGGLIALSRAQMLKMTSCSNTGVCTLGSAYSNNYSQTVGGGLLGGATSATYIDKCYSTANIFNGYYFSAHFVGSLKFVPKASILRCYAKGLADRLMVALCGGSNFEITGCYIIGEYKYGPNINASNTFPIGENGLVKITSCYFVGTAPSANGSWSSRWSSYPEYCFQYLTGGSIGNGTFISQEAIQHQRFLPRINVDEEYFVMDYEGINDGYPILKWQAVSWNKLTVTCDANRGTVKGGGEYPKNYSATLTATPKEGCMFVGWSDGNTDNPRTVTVSGNANYTAQFTKSSYTIYVNQDGTSNIE